MEKLRKFSNKYGIYMVFVVVFAAASLLSPYFCTTRNIINILRQVSVYGVLAFGMTAGTRQGQLDFQVAEGLRVVSVTAFEVTAADRGSQTAAAEETEEEPTEADSESTDHE